MEEENKTEIIDTNTEEEKSGNYFMLCYFNVRYFNLKIFPKGF
jgi:hypothetical protein